MLVTSFSVEVESNPVEEIRMGQRDIGLNRENSRTYTQEKSGPIQTGNRSHWRIRAQK